MTHTPPSLRQNAAASSRADHTRPKSKGGWAVQIFGEILITVGLVLLLFVAWQLWWTNLEANATQEDAVQSLSQEFKQAAQDQSKPSKTSGQASAAPQPNWDPQKPEITAEPGHGEAYGIAYIPRFGESYQRPLAEGTSTDVLDTLGLGHYDGTAMPGDIGNFSLAGHRQTNGAVLDRVEEIQQGDHIYIQTAQGFYTYTVYETKIVLPTEMSVIAPDPAHPGAQPTERLLTLTTCHPRYGDTERYIVHAKFDSWQPLSAGAPDEIKAAVGL